MLREAALARREALGNNRYVETYLLGQKRLPRELPGMFSIGQESEAMHCAATLGEAWHHHPQAVEWLKAQSKSSAKVSSKK